MSVDTIDYRNYSGNLGTISSFLHNQYIILNGIEYRENVYGIRKPNSLLSDFFQASTALVGLAYARYNKIYYRWPFLNDDGDLEGHTVLKDTENIDLKFAYKLQIARNLLGFVTNVEGINTGKIIIPQLSTSLFEQLHIKDSSNVPSQINIKNCTEIRHTPDPITMEDLIEFEWRRYGYKMALSTAFSSKASLRQKYSGIPATDPTVKLFLRLSVPLHRDFFKFQNDIFNPPFLLLNDLSSIMFGIHSETYMYLT